MHLPQPPALRTSRARQMRYSRRLTLALRRIYPGRVTRGFSPDDVGHMGVRRGARGAIDRLAHRLQQLLEAHDPLAQAGHLVAFVRGQTLGALRAQQQQLAVAEHAAQGLGKLPHHRAHRPHHRRVLGGQRLRLLALALDRIQGPLHPLAHVPGKPPDEQRQQQQLGQVQAPKQVPVPAQHDAFRGLEGQEEHDDEDRALPGQPGQQRPRLQARRDHP